MMLPTLRKLTRATSVGLLLGLLGTVAVLLPQATPVWAQHLDQEMTDEHNALFNLLPVASATHTAVANGNWSSAATWSGGTVPGAGARVVIPVGLTVTYDVNSANAVQWIRVNGKMAFSRTVTTALTVDTIAIDTTGEWEQGTVGVPIASNVTSTITFSGGALLSGDSYQISRGLINHGKLRICGAIVTPFVKATTALTAGQASFTLASTPTNWKAADKVFVTGMRMKDVWNGSFYEATSTDEAKNISSVSGTAITLNSGLTDARPVEYGAFGLYPYVANLTRNVVYKSASSVAAEKGHVMMMHNRDVDVRYAAFNNLGRSRKDIDITNSPTAQFPPGANPRGRYAFHFHRTGKDTTSVTPSYVQGCVVDTPTSWGFVNHDSFVNFEDNVCFNAYGAAFITENGAEIGAFRRNLASTVKGRGFIKDGTATHDLARSGTGFWFQGSNLSVENNIATGCAHGYSFFQRTGVSLGDSQKVLASTLIDPEAAGGQEYVWAPDTPMMLFKGNYAIQNVVGLFNVDNEINGIWPTKSVMEDFTILNSHGGDGMRIEYYRNFTFKNLKILRDTNNYYRGTWSGTWAMNANHLVDHLYPWETRATDWLDGVYIRGYSNGIDNDDGVSEIDDFGNPSRVAQHEVLDNSVDFVSAVNQDTGTFGTTFANTSTVLGQPLVRYTAKANQVATPTFNPPAGKYTAAQNVTINIPAGATVYYVKGTAGYTPNSVEFQLKSGSWTQYTGGTIAVGTTGVGEKLIAIALKNGVRSRIRNGVYLVDASAPAQVAAPTFSPGTGTYSSAQNVTISSATAGSTIRYTTNGTNPTSSSGTVYSGPVNIAATSTLKAIAYKSGMTDSSVSTANYTISTGSTVVTLTATADINTQQAGSGTANPIAVSQWNTVYVKFDLASITGTVTNAKVRIYKPGTTAMTFTASQVTVDSWTEATAGGSLPAIGGSLGTFASGAVAEYIEIDVTAFVQGQYAGDKIVTIAFNTNLGGWNDVQTREGANKPQLVVTRQ